MDLKHCMVSALLSQLPMQLPFIACPIPVNLSNQFQLLSFASGDKQQLKSMNGIQFNSIAFLIQLIGREFI